jgi:hypothetical protein
MPSFSQSGWALATMFAVAACGGRTLDGLELVFSSNGGAAGASAIDSTTSGGGGRAGAGPSIGPPLDDAGALGMGSDAAGGRAGSTVLDAALGRDAVVGNCPNALTGDVLDPDQVYLAGTLSEGACYRDAIAHYACPNTAVTGFDCYFDGNVSAYGTSPTALIRPTDGRLVYTNTFESVVREFHCDACPYVQGGTYPDRPLENDAVVPTDCKLAEGRASFFVSPKGELIYYCVDVHQWRDRTHRLVYADSGTDPLIHVGYKDLGLTRTRVIDLVSGKTAPVKGLEDVRIDAIRTDRSVGFIIAIRPKDPMAPEELWELDATGAMKLRGRYPPAPPSTREQDFQAQLEPGGALVQFAAGMATFEDVIIRRTIEGSSEVVYTEARGPLVKIHISGLITGP